ncbi:extracellular solute-binding protein [Rhizohabitans arisaemae]|uniref:extracellular solute-binding protein n=1 Tax=Rhizohabitans arisaemae TaxID=2720610 RepID=UPI0024B09CB0|nr:extracellular solute-binding protein [Rhizohabitans arisaemae]
MSAVETGRGEPPPPGFSPRRWGGAGFVIGLVLAGVLLITLGRGAAPPSPSGTRCDGGENVLTVATGDDISEGSYRRDLVEEWNKTRSTKVVLVEIAAPTDEERVETVGRAQLMSCTYDIFSVDVAWVAEFARNGYIIPNPLDPERAALFVDNVLEAGKVDGVQYAIPHVTDVPLLYYRRGLPVPTTREQLWDYAGRYGGYAVQLGDFEGGTVNLIEAVRSFGGRITDGDRVVLDESDLGELMRKAFATWKSGLNSVLTPGAYEYSKAETFDTFREGLRNESAGYMRNWPYAYHRLGADHSMYDAKGEMLFDVAPLPGVGILGGFNLAISATSDNPQQAREFIDYLTGHDAQMKLFACSGYPPVLKSVYEEYRTDKDGRTCKTLIGAPTGNLDGSAKKSDENDVEITGKMLKHLAGILQRSLVKAETRPKYEYYAMFSAVFRSCARAVVTGNLAAEALDVGRFADALRDAREGRWPEAPLASLAHCSKPVARLGP